MARRKPGTVDVRSSANAVGLMQLIPGTARRYAERLGIRYSSASRSYNVRWVSHCRDLVQLPAAD